MDQDVLWACAAMRAVHHLTQEELAEEAGVGVRTVRRAESGGRVGAVSSRKIARRLGMPVDGALSVPPVPRVGPRIARRDLPANGPDALPAHLAAAPGRRYLLCAGGEAKVIAGAFAKVRLGLAGAGGPPLPGMPPIDPDELLRALFRTTCRLTPEMTLCAGGSLYVVDGDGDLEPPRGARWISIDEALAADMAFHVAHARGMRPGAWWSAEILLPGVREAVMDAGLVPHAKVRPTGRSDVRGWHDVLLVSAGPSRGNGRAGLPRTTRETAPCMGDSAPIPWMRDRVEAWQGPRRLG